MNRYELTKSEQYAYMHKIEIDVTEQCNLACTSCVRGCDKFVSTEPVMSVDVIGKFVDESLDLGYEWTHIAVMGGEPTTHPDIIEIFEILWSYKDIYPSCDIWTMTNGCIPYVYPSWVRAVYNRDHSYHHAYYVSPEDVRYPRTKRTCHVLSDCGLLLSNHGYLPCCNANVHHRVFGLSDGISSLAEVTYDRMMDLCEDYCRHCGWYMMDTFRHGDLMKYSCTTMSPTWEEAFDRYHQG